MTASTNFDRILMSVLDADGPQTIDQRVVDSALASARAVPQRRPLIRGLDRRAWPGRPAPETLRLRGRQAVLVLALVGLLVALAFAAILVGTPPTRWELAADDRIVVMGRNHLVVVRADGAETYEVGATYQSCVPVVRGTTVAPIQQVGGLSMTDLSTGRVDGRIELDYAGFERWSSGGDRLALVDFAGTVTLLDVTRPTAPAVLRTIDAPGVVGFDWSLDGTRVALASLVDGELVVEVVDVSTGERAVENSRAYPSRVAYITPDEIFVDLTWASDGPTLALTVFPDLENGLDRWSVTLIPMDFGMTRHVAFVDTPGRVRISPDGSRLAVPLVQGGVTVASTDAAADTAILAGQPVADLAWAPDSRSLVANLTDRLVRVAVEEPTAVPVMTVNGSINGFGWTPDSMSVLVNAYDAEGKSVLERVDVDGRSVELIAQLPPALDWRGTSCIRIEEGVR